MFRVDKHMWRTADGRLVEHGDPDAAFLAYTAGMEIPDEEARRVGLVPVQPREKSQAKPADKSAPKSADK